MLVKLFGKEREVSVHVSGSDKNLCFGKVGRAAWRWNPKRYELPEMTKLVDVEGKLVRLRGQDLVNTRKNIKMFLMAYKALVTAPKGVSPMHTETKDREVIDMRQGKDNPHVSGVPYWMREQCKELNYCYKRNEDGTYFLRDGQRVVVCVRHTRYKEDAMDVVIQYLPYCSNCQFREKCKEPCPNPTLSVQEEIMPQQVEEESKEEIIPDYVPIVEEGMIWDWESQGSL